MRIVISGAHNTGKTTLIQSFLSNWPVYKTPGKTYRDHLKEQNLVHSSKTTPETQKSILEFMRDQFKATSKSDNVIFDRGPIDNLVYTLWASAARIEGFSDDFIKWSIQESREMLRHIDIIFLTRYDKTFGIFDDGFRDVTPGYVEDIDLIFEGIRKQYETNFEADVFFPLYDSPAVIELPNSLQDRILTIADYIGKDGDLLGDGVSIFDPANIDKLEALVNQQLKAKDQELQEQELFKKFKS